mmetsp:Transcript_30792/g.29409  ORF Transcript_30792/g.29409 Transcript_30792/m.29409 type:complete len:303 (-) Transcript_30792:177-1085(-)|eukprot:CAMPEP_0119043854 /NCGR_PEP_ID=MMETSP1177-20130426/26355_1 /TAXON_ID=2985 /ORGANISM="Ochromonas sp, Strain CCMP1899" /LENGTH=302 /DNA_ID=CAMNT_0007012851 /DNA_START=58 /DNA_END=966 /DNA_ORIENTATION=+
MRGILVSTRATVGMVQKRGMATEKQLRARITGTQNIAKITKSMKMVSASKLRGDTQRLKAADPFSIWAQTITGKERVLEDIPAADFAQKNLIIQMTSDKGLCGGVNSILCRMTRQLINRLNDSQKEVDLMILGDKGRSQMRRQYGDHIVCLATERVMPYNFELASALTTDALNSGKEYDQVHLIYNEFVSAVAYTASIKTITPLLDGTSDYLHPFDIEPSNDYETLENFYEYTLATQIFHSLMENATSEQSSRMSAMENASKNAGEMILRLSIQYNRARQTRITTDLIEIISGASALEAQKK